MTLRLGLAAAALAAALASPAWATITIYSVAPYPPAPPQTVLLNTGDSGFTVLGMSDQTGNVVVFSGEEALSVLGAPTRIGALDGGFASLNISLAPSTTGFDAIAFDLEPLASGTVTLDFTDQFGTHFGGSFAIVQGGPNLFSAVATDGELIKDVQLDTSVDLSSIGELRLGNVSALIPEPATWAVMILGVFGVGAALRRRNRPARA